MSLLQLTYPSGTIWLFGVYSVICLLLLSRVIKVFLKKHDKITEDEILDILHSPFIPKVSLLLTNDAVSSVERVFSLMALQYGNYELVLVLDQGNILLTDLKKEFILKQESNKPVIIPVNHEGVVYKSDRPGFRKLIVIEKKKNTLGDALNAGINVCSGQYVCILTHPGFLYRDCIIKLLKPFLEKFGELTASSAAVRVRPVDNDTRAGALRNIRNFVLHGAGGTSLLAIEAFCAGTGMLSKNDILIAGGFSYKGKDPVRELLFRLASRQIDRQKSPLMEYVPEVLVQSDACTGQKYGIKDQILSYFTVIRQGFSVRRSLLMLPVVFPGLAYFLLIALMLVLMIAGPGTGTISVTGSLSYFIAGYTFLVSSSLLALFIELRYSALKYSKREVRQLVSASFILPFKVHFPGKA